MMPFASWIHFPTRGDKGGMLSVYQSGEHVPFDIRRVFTVSAGKGSIRGHHAHKACSQLLVSVHGRIRVTCSDDAKTEQFDLDDSGLGLLIPPGIWAKQEYMTDVAVLMVLCDRGYEESDYIRNYDEYVEYVRLLR